MSVIEGLAWNTTAPRVRPRARQLRATPPLAVAIAFDEQLVRPRARMAGVRDVRLSWTAQQERLPRPVAMPLAVIARRLIDMAIDAFAGSRGGRISASFRVLADALELVVEHSRPSTGATAGPADPDTTLVAALVTQLGGRLECPRMIGGSRWIVTLPGLRA